MYVEVGPVGEQMSPRLKSVAVAAELTDPAEHTHLSLLHPFVPSFLSFHSSFLKPIQTLSSFTFCRKLRPSWGAVFFPLVLFNAYVER